MTYGKRYVFKVPDVRARFGSRLLPFAPSCLFFAMAASGQCVDISDDDLVEFSKKMKIPQSKQNTMLESSENIWKQFKREEGPQKRKCHVKRRRIILEPSSEESQS